MPRLLPLLGLILMLAAPGLAGGDVLEPEREWVPPSKAVEVRYAGDVPADLVLTSFVGGLVDPIGDAEVDPGETTDVSLTFGRRPAGAWLLYAVPRGAELSDGFLGTPLVLDVRGDDRPGAGRGPLVTRVTPLSYVRIATDAGDMSLALDYEASPANVAHFAGLVDGGFYDGLTFHRFVPGYLIQGGDPRGDGTGGPGFGVDAELSDRPFVLGTVALARLSDPLERSGTAPRPAAANSGGSQFFITLDLDDRAARFMRRRYSVLGRVVDGLDTLASLAARPGDGERFVDPPVITSMQLVPVTADDNPHAELLRLGGEDREALERATNDPANSPPETRPAD